MWVFGQDALGSNPAPWASVEATWGSEAGPTTVAPALSIREKICFQGDRGAIIPLSCKGFGPADLWARNRHFVCSTRATATTN